MLQTLNVKNLAIVENIEIEFEQGLNVITGETGAGKSIIAGALNLILGDRADKNMIRAGEDKCSVNTSFQFEDTSVIDAVLDNLGIDACEDGQLLIRRIISTSGSGKNMINNCPVTLQALKQAGTVLVDMHGPHDHQSLLSKDFQLDLLDAFGHTQDTGSKYEAIYKEVLDLRNKLHDLDGDDQEVAQQIDLLAYQVNEIENAELSEDEEEELKKNHTIAANTQQILELSNGINSALTESDEAAFNNIAAAQNMLRELSGILDDAEEWETEAESINIQIQELTKNVSDYAYTLDADQNNLQELDDRMTLIHSLKRKYGETIPDILEFHSKAKDRLDDLNSRGERIAEINTSLERTTKKIVKTGAKLSKDRSDAAIDLGEAITKELHHLGFEHGSFTVNLESTEPGPKGMDDIEFGFAPNVGEPSRPLRAIASSGEISRVMLATKAVLAKHDKIPILVFDEIDSNVGGEMGNAIGKKLAVVASNHQVLCITHLPQVAVHGTNHLVVSKAIQDNRTRTQIKKVTKDDRAEEVARMLGGKDLTSVTLDHAREMLTPSARES